MDRRKAINISLLIMLLSPSLLLAGCKAAPQKPKSFSIQDLVSVKNGNLEILKEEDFFNAQGPVLSPDGNNLLFATFEPDVNAGHTDDSEEDEHASVSIIYTVNNEGKVKKQFETGSHQELESINWLSNKTFVYLVSTPVKEEEEGTFLPERKAELFSVSITGQKKLLSRFTLPKDNSMKIFNNAILMVFNETTRRCELTDILTGAKLLPEAANINNAIVKYPTDVEPTVISISAKRDQYIIKTTSKEPWRSEVYLHDPGIPKAQKIATLDTDNSHFDIIAWDKNGIYLQGYQEGDKGMFYKYFDGILVKKQFPDDLGERGNYAGGRLAYETLNYPESDYIKVIDFDTSDNEDTL